MPLPDDLDIGVGVLHLRVLRARIRRARGLLRRCGVLLALLVIGAIIWPNLQARMIGQGTLVLPTIPPQTTIRIDGQPIGTATARILAGRHNIQLARDGYYPARLEFSITRDLTTTLELPLLRPRPQVQSIPLPGVGMRWKLIQSDPVGWRLTTQGPDAPPRDNGGRQGAGEAPPTLGLWLDERGLTRQPTLTSSGIADEQVTASGRHVATWEPLVGRGGWRDPERGLLTIATPGHSVVITLTTPISGLWWALDGSRLLVASASGAGQDLHLWDRSEHLDALGMPVVTIPGDVELVRWQSDSLAAVVLSQTLPLPAAGNGRLTPTPMSTASLDWEATLVVAADRDAPRAIRLAPPPPAPFGMVPMAWDADSLLWATESGRGLALDRIRLDSALPERLGSLPNGTLALTTLDDGQIRLVVRDGGHLRLEAWPQNVALVTLDEVGATETIGAAWLKPSESSGSAELLLASAATADLWLLTFDEATLR